MKTSPKRVIRKTKDLIVESKSAETLNPVKIVQHFAFQSHGLSVPKSKLCVNKDEFRSFTTKIVKRQKAKYEELMEKIKNVPSVGKISEKDFRTSIKEKLQGLNEDRDIEKQEIKEVVDKFEYTLRGRMFSITKTGQKFRKAKLGKKLKGVEKFRIK